MIKGNLAAENSHLIVAKFPLIIHLSTTQFRILQWGPLRTFLAILTIKIKHLVK